MVAKKKGVQIRMFAYLKEPGTLTEKQAARLLRDMKKDEKGEGPAQAGPSV